MENGIKYVLPKCLRKFKKPISKYFKLINQFIQNGGILTPKELYCVMGCNDAVTKYFSQLRIQLGTPPAPALVADSLQSTSLKLEWNFPEAKKAGLDCHIQWKYEELSASWQYCRNTTWDNQNSIVSINNLQPYTKYKVENPR